MKNKFLKSCLAVLTGLCLLLSGGAYTAYAESEESTVEYAIMNGKIDYSTLEGNEVASSQDRVFALDTALNTKVLYTNTEAAPTSTLQWEMTEPTKLDAYAFVTDYGISGASAKGTRDPWAWTFYGSNDLSGDWTVLSEVTEGNLPAGRTTQSDAFVIENPDEYQYYKIVITGNRSGFPDGVYNYCFTDLLLLAETTETEAVSYNALYDYIDTTSFSGDETNGDSQTISKVFDNNTGTKVLFPNVTADNPSRVMQWAMTQPVRLDAYALVTSNNMNGRDPFAWTLYASNDVGEEKTWTVLSDVDGYILPMAAKTQSDPIVIETPGEYQYYKLEITDNRCHISKSDYQMYSFSELVLLTTEDMESAGGEEEEIPEEVPFEIETDSTDLHVLITSDVHYTDLYKNGEKIEWYGVSQEDRMQLWVDSVKKEHAENPYDMIIINGDTSLDYWISGGSQIVNGTNTTEIFIKDYVSQLPEEIPVFIFPGNHEQYTDAQWFAMTGCHRRGTILLGDALFICPDSYGADLDPAVNSDGTYTPMDVEYIKAMMEKYPDTDVYIVAHNINVSKESDEFKELVATNDRIIGMFMGHTHHNTVKKDVAWGTKTIAQTGQFSYTNGGVEDSFWGFRELVITSDLAYSQYIMVECDAVIDEANVHYDRTTNNAIVYYGEAPDGLIEDPFSEYINLQDKIDQSSITGDAGTTEDEGIDKLFDNDYYTKWCVETTIGEDGTRTVQWAMTEPVMLEAYALVTGNDMNVRDPWTWTLYGSDDPNGEWSVLAAVEESNLTKSRNTPSGAFEIENPGEYQYYKLVITDNRAHRNKTANRHYQASELILLACAHGDKTEVPAKVADCTNAGNNQYYTCACGAVLKADGVTETTVEAETIPATGHVNLTEVPVKAADCTNAGNNQYYTCACGAVLKSDKVTETTVEAETISATGHVNLTEVPAKSPDYTTPGNYQYYICACGVVLKADKVTETTVEAETIPALEIPETEGSAGESSGSEETEGNTGESSGSAETEGNTGESGGSAETEGNTGETEGSAETEGNTGESGGSAETEGNTGETEGSTETEGSAGESGGSAETEGGAGETEDSANAGSSAGEGEAAADTGDHSAMYIWSMLVIISAMALVAVAFVKKREVR